MSSPPLKLQVEHDHNARISAHLLIALEQRTSLNRRRGHLWTYTAQQIRLVVRTR
jgi:hypothetical protein